MKLPVRLTAIAALFAALLPLPALAAGICGLATVNGGTASSTYDPFNPTSSTITISGLVLTRVNGPGGQKTSSINFYVKGQNTNQNGSTMVINSATGSGSGTGYGSNVFFNASGPFPTPLNNSGTPVAGIFRWEFSGNNDASDTFTVNMTLTLPANLNLTSSTQLKFDIEYSCAGTGGGGPFTDTGTVNGAISANVTVQSALRASLAGDLVGGAPSLAFGEIGNEVGPGKKTSANNYIRVQSTAPYDVTLHSERGYRMTVGGAAGLPANQQIGYNLKFVGATRNPGGADIVTTCNIANVGDALEDKLYIQAQLAEAANTKAPSTDYFDTLTVTLAPKAIGTVYTAHDCGNDTVF